MLSDDDLRRIGAGAVGVATSGLQGGEAAKGSVPAPSPVFDWQGEYAYSLGVQGPDLRVPVCVRGADAPQVGRPGP
jgi:hypothetical protein